MNIIDAGIVIELFLVTVTNAPIVKLIIVLEVWEVPEEKPAKKISSHLYRFKIGAIFLGFFALAAFLSDYNHMERSDIWFDLMYIMIGYMFGTGISIGFSR